MAEWDEIEEAAPEAKERSRIKREANEKKFAKRKAELDASKRPIIADLSAAGFDVDSAFDFITWTAEGRDYSGAFPILEAHLKRHEDYLPNIKEGLLRALTIPQARGVGIDAALELYEDEDQMEHVRFAAINMLSETAIPRLRERLEALLPKAENHVVEKTIRTAIATASRPLERTDYLN